MDSTAIFTLLDQIEPASRPSEVYMSPMSLAVGQNSLGRSYAKAFAFADSGSLHRFIIAIDLIPR